MKKLLAVALIGAIPLIANANPEAPLYRPMTSTTRKPPPAPPEKEMAPQKPKVANGTPAPYEAQDYSRLLGMPGFSNDALNIHFKLYQGYVKNANLLLSILNQYAQAGQARTPQFAEIKRRLGWEMDGMRLHEYYFGQLGGDGQPNADSNLYKAIEAQYGSYDAWKKDFQSVGAMRGIGWAILYMDPTDGRLINMWINEHDHGHLAAGVVLLPMDVFEHAYLIDYGVDRQAYIDAFFKNLDWKVIEPRYDEANPQP